PPGRLGQFGPRRRPVSPPNPKRPHRYRKGHRWKELRAGAGFDRGSEIGQKISADPPQVVYLPDLRRLAASVRPKIATVKSGARPFPSMPNTRAELSVTRKRWVSVPYPFLVLFIGCPQTKSMHRSDVSFGLLLGTVGHNGLALMMYLQHQIMCNRCLIPKIGTKHVGDITHQVHRVIPDDHFPRFCDTGELIDGNIRVNINCARNGHGPYSRHDQPPACATYYRATLKSVIT